jgi:hypothetical protein
LFIRVLYVLKVIRQRLAVAAYKDQESSKIRSSGKIRHLSADSVNNKR